MGHIRSPQGFCQSGRRRRVTAGGRWFVRDGTGPIQSRLTCLKDTLWGGGGGQAGLPPFRYAVPYRARFNACIQFPCRFQSKLESCLPGGGSYCFHRPPDARLHPMTCNKDIEADTRGSFFHFHWKHIQDLDCHMSTLRGLVWLVLGVRQVYLNTFLYHLYIANLSIIFDNKCK